jgi:hypothetical protein
MKPYGHSRSDKLECKYGCCTGKSGKMKNCRSIVDKVNRKTARQEAKKAQDCNISKQFEEDDYENN